MILELVQILFALLMIFLLVLWFLYELGVFKKKESKKKKR